MKMNPPEADQKNESINSFINYLDKFLVPQSIQQVLPPSDVVGNIRFSHPTLYVFPGGQGDSALFGINGFNLLVDGGFSRRACFWDFSRHLDRLDAVLITRVSDDNTGGMSALLQRKTTSALYPQIGHVFANLPSKMMMSSQNDDDEENDDNLIINVIEEGNSMLQSLQILNLQPQVCLRDKDAAYRPINLYHKVGHGKLDMYVVNPSRDAKDLKEFMERWNGENSKTLGTFRSGINVDGKELWLPLANLVSICALLVWLPDNPDDTVTRLLFPGSTPQNKVLKGLEKLRDLDFMQKPVCASRSVQKPTKQAPQKRESSKYGYRSTSRKPVMKDTVKEKSLDSVGGSKENIEKQDVTAKSETPGSRKTSAAQRKEEREKREEKERKRKEEKKKLLEEKEQKMLKAKEEKEKAEKLRRQQEKERRQQMKEVREKLESEKRTTRRKVSEEKELKEQQNQAQASDLKGKEKATGLKREKPLASSRTKRNEAIKAPSKAKPDQPKKSITADKHSSLPSSKLRKDASNKTKKEEGIKSKLDTGIKSIKSKSKPSEAKSKDEKVESVPSNVPVATDNVVEIGNDEEVESIVEKHQIEAMETSPIDEQAHEDGQRGIEDDIEPELERIKDEEDDVNNQGLRVADIPVAQPEAAALVVEPLMVSKDVHKASAQHVKTPDEVPDLPEDEVATEVLENNVPEVENNKSPVKEFEMEEKIALDLQEKEIQSEKDNKEEEKDVRDEKEEPDESDVKNLLSPESEGAQEQKEVSEMLITAPQVASIEEKQTEEALEENKNALVSEGKDSPLKIDEDQKSEPNKEDEKDEMKKEMVDETKEGEPSHDEEKLKSPVEEAIEEKVVEQVHEKVDNDNDKDQEEDVVGAEQSEEDAFKEKFNAEIENLLTVLGNIEEICVKESNAVISQENADEVMLKDIATALNDTHKLKDDCKQFDYANNKAEICRISDDTECLVKKVIKLAIELIGNDTSLACDLMEDVQKEADLILQCKTAKLVYPEDTNDGSAEDGENDKDSDNALELNIPMNIKELKVQESKEQASPKSESQSIISADTSNRDMDENIPNNNEKGPTEKTSDDEIADDKDNSHNEPDDKANDVKTEDMASSMTEGPEAVTPISPGDKIEETKISDIEPAIELKETKENENAVENEEVEEKTGEHDAPSAELKEAIAEDDNLKVDKKVEMNDVDENSPKVVDETASEVVESTSPSKSPAAPDSSNEKEDEDEQDKPLDSGDKNQNATKEEMKIHSEKDTNDETQNEVSEIIECTQSKKNEGELSASNIENDVSNTLDAERSASDAHEEQVVEVPVKEEFQNDNKVDVSISESSSKPQELESPEESQDAKEEIKSHLTKEEEQSKDDEDKTSSKDEKESSEKGISPVPSEKEKDQASDETKFDNESEADEKIETQDVTADQNDQEKSDDLIEDKTSSGNLATEISSDEKITADAQVEKHAEVLAQASEDASDKDNEKTTPSKEELKIYRWILKLH